MFFDQSSTAPVDEDEREWEGEPEEWEWVKFGGYENVMEICWVSGL